MPTDEGTRLFRIDQTVCHARHEQCMASSSTSRQGRPSAPLFICKHEGPFAPDRAHCVRLSGATGICCNAVRIASPKARRLALHGRILLLSQHEDPGEGDGSTRQARLSSRHLAESERAPSAPFLHGCSERVGINRDAYASPPSASVPYDGLSSRPACGHGALHACSCPQASAGRPAARSPAQAPH